jgi:hypothetical protein
MKPAVEKQLKVQIPTPLVGEYMVRLLAVDGQMVQAVINNNGREFSTILPATISHDWLKTMKNKYVDVVFKTAKTQTEVIIQDRVGYVDNKRVYINSRNGMPKISVVSVYN